MSLDCHIGSASGQQVERSPPPIPQELAQLPISHGTPYKRGVPIERLAVVVLKQTFDTILPCFECWIENNHTKETN